MKFRSEDKSKHAKREGEGGKQFKEKIKWWGRD